MNEYVDNELETLTEAVLGSYRQHDSIHRIDERHLPTRSTIVALLDQLRQLIFPGYFGHKTLTSRNVSHHVGNLLSRIGEALAEEIRHCVCSRQGRDCTRDMLQCQRQAEKLAGAFLETIPAIREQLAMDAQAAYDGDPAARSIDEVVYCYPGFYAVFVYRIAHGLLELGVPLMPRILSEHAHSVTGTDIHPGATIGQRFFIDHATGVVIGETTNIGDNVKIYQGVTLGALSIPKDERGRAIKGIKRHPTIEDNVTIYANATILGGETVIGQGVTVGGNTFVTESIQADSTVLQQRGQLEVREKPARQK
jgi:serine O-acetyltransferase